MRLRHEVAGFLLGCALWLGLGVAALASPYRGQVTFNGMPLPGSQVTVTATQGDKKVVAMTDDQGLFNFPDLADGNWTLEIDMTGFAPIKQQVAVTGALPVATFEMKLLTLAEIRTADQPVKVDPTLMAAATPAPAAAITTPAGAAGAAAPAGGAKAGGKTQAAGGAGGNGGGAPAPEPAQSAESAQASDGFLINGSVNNAATSQFSLNQAFGNNRNGGRWKYNGGLSLQLINSALNARPFSLSGADTAKLPYTNLIAGAQVGGPLIIPHFLPYAKAPYFYAGYQRTENKTENLGSVLMPTAAMIGGNLSGLPNVTAIYVPTSGLSAACLATPGVTPGGMFAGNIIPAACITPQAKALLNFYPQGLTQFPTTYNYQAPLANDTHTDSYRGNIQKGFGNKNQLQGNITISDTRSSTPSIFGFLDTGRSLSENVSANWYHRFTQRVSMNAGYNFSRSRNNNYSYFANKQNVSLAAGITGNDQDPNYWGPPGISFGSSAIAGLGDGTTSKSTPETNAVSLSMQWNRFRHNMTFGGDFRRQQSNYLNESNPRGSMSFTGAQTANSTVTGSGSDFADFLLGLPDASSIAYGNADKYLRQNAYDLYADDDFRVNPELSVRAGVRWEYGSPVTEIKNRLVNLDVTPNFTASAPVVGTSPTGPVSNQKLPSSLMFPDYSFPEPRVGIAWRPISGSSLLVKAGYGIYNDTSVYLSTARAMSQQAPLSTSLSVPSTAACQIVIATPFVQLPCAKTTADAFAVDPHFKVGYAQQWQLSLQRDLPFALQFTATYTGIKGTRGVQEILPNTYAPGLATSPYGSNPVGFYWRMSNGNSTREAGMVQLRRRLRNGFTASINYTYSKSLDDDYSYGGSTGVPGTGSGSPQVAQDWTNPAGQRGLSTFDQRNLLQTSLQYTTGMGIGGHTLMGGWRAALYKEWTVQASINEGSGTPETPIAPIVVPGSGFSNVVRANYLGGAIHELLPNNTFLNPAAFATPTSGWGTARRGSITGPSQFSMNASMARTWRLHDRYNVDARLDVTNVLNHVAYSGWNTTLGTSFGEPNGTQGMRSMQITIRGRF